MVLRVPRRCAACLFALMIAVLSAARQNSTPSPDTSPELFSRVVANQKRGETLLDQYERIQRIEKRRVGSDSDPTTTTCYRQFPAGPAVDKISLSPDGKPANPETYRTDLEKLEKYLVWAMEDGQAQKDAYARAERKRKERFDLMDATHQAFLFKFEGTEKRAGRTLLRYSMTPNPTYRPTTRNTLIFTRVRGTLWIDQESSELAKIDGSVTEDISIALFLAKVYKGSHFMQERYEIAPGVWEPTFEQYDFDGRKYLMPFSIHERTFYSDYKRVGPPKEAVEVVRGELSKLETEPAPR
jgi:hypothetical protein